MLFRFVPAVFWSVVLFSVNVALALPEIPTEREKATISDLIRERQSQFPRGFKQLKLENGLEVLLIKDTRAKEVGASMDVAAGFWMDPPQLRGLAHYLEHMLFLGTQKYPKASEYHEFMQQNGGQDNAFTTVDHTNYHFTIQAKFLDEALDRFGHFFIDPTFPSEFVLRELDAVDAEFKKDELRFENRVDYLESILSNPAHRNSRVFQGSVKSLGYVGEKNLRDALVAFHRRHYTADQMKLVIVGPMSLKKLEPTVKAIFSQIPRSTSHFPKPAPKPLMNERALPELVELKPAGNEKKLILRFELPSWYHFMYSSPHSLLSDLLRRSGEGTLVSILRGKGWITDLTAGGADLDSHNLFKVEFELTESGLDRWKDVCNEFFQAVAFFKSVELPLDYFEATQKDAELNFSYHAPARGEKMAIRYASRMQFLHWTSIEAMEDLLVRYERQALLPLLEQMRPEKMQIFLTEGRLEAGWPGTKSDGTYPFLYRTSRVSSSDIRRWSEAPASVQLRLPKANPFVPKSRNLIGIQDLNPRVLIDDEFQKLWIQTDHQFRVPSAQMTFEISSARPETLHEFARLEVFFTALERSNQKWREPATQVGYGGQLSRSKTGFELMLSGYTDKFLEFSDAFIGHMLKIDLTEAEFENVRSELLDALDKIDVLDPYLVANWGRMEVLQSQRYPHRQIREFVSHVTLAEVQGVGAELLNSVYLKGVAFGNITPEMALHVSSSLLRLAKGNPLKLEERPLASSLALQPGPGVYYQTKVNGKNQGWLSFFEFGGPVGDGRLDPNLRVDLQLGEAILASWIFDELRTKRSIGYIVFANSLIDKVLAGFDFLIQSDWPLQKIQATADEFIRGAGAKIRSLSTDQFRAVQDAYIKDLQNQGVLHTFNEKASFVKKTIFEYGADFGWQIAQVQAAQNSTQARVADLFDQHLSEKGQKRLNIYVQGRDGEGAGMVPAFGGRQIENIEAFKINAPRHVLKK